MTQREDSCFPSLGPPACQMGPKESCLPPTGLRAAGRTPRRTCSAGAGARAPSQQQLICPDRQADTLASFLFPCDCMPSGAGLSSGQKPLW